jgi:outer membrane immunogenic protein
MNKVFGSIALRTLVTAPAMAAMFTGSAIAADLAKPVYKAPPPPAPVYSWTGFYVGGNVGGNWSDSNTVELSTATGSIFPAQPVAPIVAAGSAALTTGSFGTGSKGSFIGGGQIGYNFQSGAFVAGMEADIQGLANQNSGSTTIHTGGGRGGFITSTVSVDRSQSYFGTVRARLGYLATPALLIYGTGGLAYGGVRTSASITQTISPAPLTGAFASNSVSDTRVGWTVGGGLEWMFAPNWSAKAEYLYYDLGTVNYGVGSIAPILTGNAVGAGSPLFVNNVEASTRFNGNIVRVGLNYQFH